MVRLTGPLSAARHNGAEQRIMGPDCKLRHRRTDQVVTVPLTKYLRHCRGRFKNWQIAGGITALHPPATLSELIFLETNNV
jgi:hypothetical protein